MKVVFISNYFNHHQKPFSEAMYAKLGDDYTFIETEEMTEERKSMGWEMRSYPPYVVRNNVFSQSPEQYAELIRTADLVIIGSAPEHIIQHRKHDGGLVFRCSERPLKNGIEPLKFLPRLLKWQFKNISKQPIYMLSASAYTASDYAKFGLFKNRCYKWGYFPAVKKYENIDDLIEKKTPSSILWVARFIDWKHPEICVEIAKRLKNDGYSFQMDLIGNGVMEKSIREQISSEKLEDHVHLLGTMTPDEVRLHMENSQIFLFTSDKGEGWGAVLNESLNSGCAAIANRAIGAAPFLVEDGKNGVLYEDGNIDELYEKVKVLLVDHEKRITIAKNAYQTIIEEWNAENAADKLLVLAEKILNGEVSPTPFEHGVCSRTV